MDRHAKSGMLAAGLISGVTAFIIYRPHLQRALRRLTMWLMETSTKPIGQNMDEHITSPQTDLPYRKQNVSENIASPQTTLPNLNQSSTNNSESSDSISETDESTSSSDEEVVLSNKISLKSSVFPGDLPDEGKELLKNLENYSIFTETVNYKPKSDRNSSDQTVYCKNLFLKDRKGKFYFFICREESNVLLRQLKYKLKAHRNFSFASQVEVEENLHVLPGCITPFVFLSETVSRDIPVAIARDLILEKRLNFHPLHADFATRISFGHLLKLFGHLKRKLIIIDV
ncbi:uncharacterized protein LOC134683041 [Mytilus trossulus]|uniref:uncharacterized protein LOC134683041 n=1 Tax=Mytilus trossulus TaxID=6551 RepID=UPI003003C2A0